MTCLHWTIYSWQSFNSLECPLILKTNYRCVQSLNISVDDAKCVENVHKFTKYTHFLSVLVLIEQSIHGKLSTHLGCPLMLRTNYRCVKSLNISVDVPNVWKMFTNSPSSLTFCPLQKTTCPDWTIYVWQGLLIRMSTSMLRTNYRCVQSLNISVDVAKCVEIVHTLIHYTHFLDCYKKWLVFTEQSIHGKVSTH